MSLTRIVPQEGDKSFVMRDWRHGTYYLYGRRKHALIARSENCKVVVREMPEGDWCLIGGQLNGDRAFEKEFFSSGFEALEAGLDLLDRMEMEKPWDEMQIRFIPTHANGRPIGGWEVGIIDCRPDYWKMEKIPGSPPTLNLG